MSFEFKKLEIDGLVLIMPEIHGDSRGFFLESYKKSDFQKAGIDNDFIQDNHSKSSKGVLRGLHYQSTPKQQSKLVRCTKGKIYDIAVDLRKNSQTFAKWVKVELSEDNKSMLYIPKGFAHGFVVLSDYAELMYKTDVEFSPANDRGLLWNDKEINIDWGIDFVPTLSEKDKNQPELNNLNREELL